MPATPRRCDAVTVTGGAWEAWCSAAGAYIWARFDGLTVTGAFAGCMNVSDLNLLQGANHASAANGGHGGGTSEHGVPSYFFSKTMSTTVVIDAMLPAEYGQGGTGHLFLGAGLALTCGGPDGGFAPGPETIVSGVSMTWNPKDGG
jgi:hypothetical protein